MVANETTEEPLLLKAIEGEDYGHGEEAEGSRPIMDEGFLDMDTQCNPFERLEIGIRIGNFKVLCGRIQVEESIARGETCSPQEHGVMSKLQPKLGSRSD